MGDATTIVYLNPLFSALFSYIALGEQIDWSFYPIATLDAIGLLLITQPTFLFGGSASEHYSLGALSAFVAAVVIGLMVLCTRKSKEAFWTAVNLYSCVLSAFVFTPLATAVWIY
jgi:EamA-like transporter family.